ncbi:MAG: hypothetical protein ACRDOZ_07945 [Nocardioides sp.]
MALGLVAALSTASPARADDTQPCVPMDAWTETVVDQAAYDETVVDKEAWTETIPGESGVWANWSPTDTRGPQDYTPIWPTDDRGTWQVHDAVPPGHAGPDGVYQQGAGNSPWFYRQAGTADQVIEHPAETHVVHHPAITHTVDHPAVTCDDPGPDCEANPQADGCPPVDNGKKVVVCKYVGTPPGTLHHIVIVSENSLNNTPYVAPPDGDSWTDAQGQTTEGSVAIRYAEEGEQAQDVALTECPGEEEPEVCPPGTDHEGELIPAEETEESFCDDEVDPGPDTCPEGTDHAGEEIPADKTEEEFCDDDDEEDVCPEGSDHAGEEVPSGETEEEFCDDDDVNPGPDCEEDPTQKKCEEDKPPVVPNDGNSPSNGPTVKGASATAPTAAAGTTVAGTPAARVPTAVNAGLGSTQQELAGNGGTLGLLGIATALLGAALVGMTFRPRRGRTLAG